MGIDDLALAVASGDAISRKVLMYAVSDASENGSAWAARLRGRIVETGDA